jgi:hypothetical protein
MHSSQVFGSAGKKRVVLDELSSSEEADEDDDVMKLPVRKVKRGKKRRVADPASSGGSPSEDHASNPDESDEDDEPLVNNRALSKDDDSNPDESDEDDEPPANPAARRKRRIVSDDSDDKPLIPSSVKRRRLIRADAAPSLAKHRNEEDEDSDEEPAPSSARPIRTRRKPLTRKEKAWELRRRKRAREVINEEDESPSSEDEEPAKGIYDTDSDILVLEEFEDDEEGVPGSKTDGKNGNSKKNKKKKQKVADDADSDTSMDDFIVDDSDAPLGAPDEDTSIPLEFTMHSHRPLKKHFRDAIEWLVQLKINPGYSEKENELYRIAWNKLDDEVRGLATSKFSSAAWTTDFYKALRARPYLHNEELPKGDLSEIKNCGACGRTNHPAK